MLEYRQTEIRAGEGRILTGLALPYETEARIGAAGRKLFVRGSAKTTGEALLNVHHRGDRPLAREPGTLEFESRDDGLHVRASLPETREADDALALVKSGVIRGLSIEFRASRETMRAGVRVIQAAMVSGLALVTRAAYQSTTVEARGAALATALAASVTGTEIEMAARIAGITQEQLRQALFAFGATFPEPEVTANEFPDWML